MRHVLRKYTSNRGSALFMVISTMTALFISCMAMYFSMASARSSQNVVFNKLQANQSAMSISRIVANGISSYSEDPDSLYQKGLHLGIGESITTDGNGFKSLDPNNAAGLDLDNLGAYSVTITCVDKDANGNVTLDVMVITSVDGNRDSIHMTVTINETLPDNPPGQSGAGGDAELFAATGYVPNDAYATNGYFLTDVFYDTQFTYLNTFEGATESRMAQSVSTGGTMFFDNGAMSALNSAGSYTEAAKSIGPVTWAVRGDLYANFGNKFEMRGGSQILVGGDFVRGKNAGDSMLKVNNDNYTGSVPLGDHISIYINGDFYFNNTMINNDIWFFVNGNVYGLSDNPANSGSNIKIFVTGDIDAKTGSLSAQCKNKLAETGVGIYEWKASGTDWDQGLTYTEAIQLLGQKTATISYYKWDLTDNTKNAPHIDIRINSDRDNNPAWTDDKGNTYEAGTNCYIISYDKNTSSAKYIKGESTTGAYPGVIGDSFVIDSVWTRCGQNTNGTQAIIIDTGDNPDNIITLKLCDVTGGDKIFTWFYDEGIPEGMFSDAPRLVLLRGRGTVLIDIPAGITYQDVSYMQTVHASWYLAEKGHISSTTKNGKEYISFHDLGPQDAHGPDVANYIHRTCNGPSDGCEFTYKDSTATCDLCGGKLKTVHCSVHEDVNKYCPKCYPEKNSRNNWCVNHVDRKAFDTFYGGLSGIEKEFASGADHKVVYPTTNFMLISCEESAEMLFSVGKKGNTIDKNSFFGFIYAPYMTFLASGGSGGGFVKICGGMTVSDYDFNSTQGYIGCYPDKMPNEIAGMKGGGDMSGGKLEGASKSWKVEIGGYK